MAKITITKKLVEENSQLAELLTERNIEVGSKMEQTDLDELYQILETTHLIELTQEHFDKEPELSDKDLKVGDKVRVKKPQESETTEESVSYIVAERFKDKDDHDIIYEVNQEIPAHFDAERIQDLLDRGLIKQA